MNAQVKLRVQNLSIYNRKYRDEKKNGEKLGGIEHTHHENLELFNTIYPWINISQFMWVQLILIIFIHE